MKKTQAKGGKGGLAPSQPVRCNHCGREMTAGHCANLRCSGISWRTTRLEGSNVVELRPVVERGRSTSNFVGALYTKEIRFIDGCECQGVSVSTVASSGNRKDVVRQIVAVAKERAQQYSCRGYKVVLTKLLAA